MRFFSLRLTHQGPFEVSCVAPPKPTIAHEGGLLTSSSETGNQWLKNGVAIAGATEQTYVADGAGAYSVRVTIGGCSTESDPTTIVGMQEPSLSGVRVYPNPALDRVNVELNASIPTATAEIYTVTGIRIKTTPLISTDGLLATAFDMSHYPAGMYVLRITTPRGTIARKIRKR